MTIIFISEPGGIWSQLWNLAVSSKLVPNTSLIISFSLSGIIDIFSRCFSHAISLLVMNDLLAIIHCKHNN
ncbi:unnamed protein product [Leptidea sinapis]|uniref:Uncharacterized protein n=1 Tax=Leptidea sinapis TaxID=189913 RepID=A0A5E4Q1N5_9NEOP|nr:unnamed protein product [Leptidea sinapis]